MKNKSTLLRDAIALFLITLVSGLALSYVYESTKAPIEQMKEEKKLKANQAVFTDASTFVIDDELMEIAKNTDLEAINAEYKGVTIEEVSKAFDSYNEAIGYNITVKTTNSYKDYITMVIGYSKDKKINGIELLTITETAGLGMKADTPEFINQYTNKKVEQFVVTKAGATTEDQIDAISGATITTKAVTYAINAGIAFLNENASDLGGGQNE